MYSAPSPSAETLPTCVPPQLLGCWDQPVHARQRGARVRTVSSDHLSRSGICTGTGHGGAIRQVV